MGNKVFVRILVVALGLFSLSCAAQVLSLGRMTDPVSRQLQKQYFAQLQQLSSDAAALHFPYPFYFSQVLDVDEARQKQLPQGSIRFDQFNGQTVLAISGNYYISYSAELLNRNQRARKTYEDVVVPLLKAAVARVDHGVPFDAYAFEVSHHVRRKVMKVNTEGAENLMVVFPRAIAARLVRAKDAESQQSALLESEIYLNGEPFTLWLGGDDAPDDVKDHYLARHGHSDTKKTSLSAEPPEPGTLVNSNLVPESELARTVRERRNAPHDISPVKLEKLYTAYQGTLQQLVPELKQQAHFVEYAPPAFIAFHDGAYLQFSMNTDLEQPAGSSQYRIAAMAFESHISHVLRPVAKYFHDNPQFDGVDFTTTVHQSVQPSSMSVEFVVPFSALVCYEKYDCTGQELVNRSIVLINGERVALDLQRAETDSLAK
ncbi:MAG: hypothetical protein LAO78_14440 [Acidobacteriia bacterium]|nr:hypothetical protein [Terriglobia bacterium]